MNAALKGFLLSLFGSLVGLLILAFLGFLIWQSVVQWNAASAMTDAGAKLQAIASIGGSLIGAIVSGLLAVGAAFVAVNLEREHQDKAEQKRRRAVAAPVRIWCDALLQHNRKLASDIRRIIKAKDLTEKVPLFVGHTMQRISSVKLDADLRARTEGEFLIEKRVIDRVLQIQGYFESAGPERLERFLSLAGKSTHEAVAINGLTEILSHLIALSDAIGAVYGSIEHAAEAAQVIELGSLISETMYEANERRHVHGTSIGF